VVQGDSALRDLSAAEVVGRGYDIESTWVSAWAQTRVLERPQSLSAHVYLWCDGRLRLVPTYFASDGIRFYPPTELAELIDQTDDSS
jgi:hypothetical protein